MIIQSSNSRVIPSFDSKSMCAFQVKTCSSWYAAATLLLHYVSLQLSVSGMTFLCLRYCVFAVQVPDLDVIVGSVSGGGFVAGMCVAAKVSF